jgi:hypothetical protein
VEQFHGVLDLVADALAARLIPRPEFQVLGTIVEPVTVSVMNRFVARERSPEHLRHDIPMLELLPLLVDEPALIARDRDDAIAVSGNGTRP